MSAAGLSPLMGCGTPAPSSAAFLHGVASGDPTESALILWTRLSGVTEPTEVQWIVARDPALEDMLAEGTAMADAERDFTVKVDAQGLPAGTPLHYGFQILTEAGMQSSPVGRARTLGTKPSMVRIGVVTCASLAHGYLHGYRLLSARELDLVVHLGDAIYEFGDGEYGSVRGYEPPHECRTLLDYRTRHAQYRREPELMALSAAHPMVMLWDDHEFANNAYEDGSAWHDGASKGAWSLRRDAARRAFFEWMPVREQEGDRLYRSIVFGDLASLSVVDTRMDGRGPPARDTSDAADPARRIFSPAQERWLELELSRTDVRYRVLAQAVLFAQHPEIFGLDAWDGFLAQRQRLLERIATQPLPTLITLAGDSHASWAAELALDPFGSAYDPATGAGAIGVELGVPGVSSPNYDPADAPAEEARILSMSPHTRYTEQSSRGYLVLTLTNERATAERFFVEGIASRDGGTERPGPVHEILAGTSRFTR